MTIQTNSNVLVALRKEVTAGVTATVTSAFQVRIIGSPGLTLQRAPITSAELREDGSETMGRLGGKSVDGSFDTELTAGGAIDYLVEGLMRSAWVTQTAVGFATLTTVAVGTNNVTATAGDWVAEGVRVGDVFRLTTGVAANADINKVVIAVTSLTITTTPASFTVAAATSTGTLTVRKKVKSGTTPTRRSHTIEQYDQDTDLTELFLGCRVVGFKISAKPNEEVKCSFMFKGMDRSILTTATSPYFTSPSLTTGISMIADDASVLYNGALVTTFTGIDLDFTIAAEAQAVLGSFVSPDIFDNILSVKGTITGLRSDFSNLTLYDAETEFAVNVLFQELASAPKPFFNVFLPRVKISALSAPVGGQTGPKIETLELMVGTKVAATGSDGTIATFSSSVVIDG
jgi:hypothetical protein